MKNRNNFDIDLLQIIAKNKLDIEMNKINKNILT
jgi:hypothetical protein